jgi:hypothetical protein
VHISSFFYAQTFRGIFLPFSLEAGWICILAFIKTHFWFLKKSSLNPQHIISSLKFDCSSWTPHHVTSSGSFYIWPLTIVFLPFIRVATSSSSSSAATVRQGIVWLLAAMLRVQCSFPLVFGAREWDPVTCHGHVTDEQFGALRSGPLGWKWTAKITVAMYCR